FESILAFFANQQGRGVIVVGQRTESIQDLIKEILRMELLQDFPVDPIAHRQRPHLVHLLKGFRGEVRDAREHMLIVPLERMSRARERHRRPGSAPPAQRCDQQVISSWWVLTSNEPSQELEVPWAVPGKLE